jgi:hypothetical protein
MEKLSLERVQAYRAETYRLQAGRQVHSLEEAVAYVAERGFIYFWPIQGVIMPSLWTAVAGDRPVADAHDDPGHVTWGWKDSTLGQRRWYYAKVLRRKATIISLALAPTFYALSENFGSPEEDYLDQYRQGTLTVESKMVYEALLREGPLHTLALRQAAFLTGEGSEYRFNRALDELQADFKILPVGVAKAGAWRYAFIYDIVTRHYPELPDQARAIGLAEAQRTLLLSYLRSVGAVPEREVVRLFGWAVKEALAAADILIASGVFRRVRAGEQPGDWLVLTELVEG